MIQDLNQLINGEDVYKDLQPNFDDKFKPRIGGIDMDLFNFILAEEKTPELIVEVGTWWGRSAILMGEALRECRLNTKILCVDTFCGSFIHRLNDSDKTNLNFKRGRAQLYEDFLGNVVAHNLQNTIIPYVGTSSDAFRYLKHFNIQPDIAYIDASHEFEDVYADLTNYWKVLKIPGVMFGDDFGRGCPGVLDAVLKFSEDIQTPVGQFRDQFIFKKTT